MSTHSDRMRRVARRDTRPEMALRRLLWRSGLRYRLHLEGMPGTPDLAFPRHRLAVFVHGCFWHRHAGCRFATIPKTRREYWLPKLEANVERDERKNADLRRLGWRSVIVWECETRTEEGLNDCLERIRSALHASEAPPAKRSHKKVV